MVLSILPLALVKILQSTWLGGHQIHFHESKLIEFVGFLVFHMSHSKVFN